MKTCLNCTSYISDKFQYCPSCGQETKLDQSVKSLFSHFLNDYFTFDSKIVRSILPLITRPAFLTKQFLAGRRVQYIAPLRLFIFLSLIFFLVLSTTNTSAVEITKSENEDFWNRFFDNWLPKLFFFLLPLFALIISLLYRKKKLGLMPHFLFALHFHASLFLMGILYGLLSFVFAKLNWFILNEVFLVLVGLYLAFYLWRSLRKMYGESRLMTSWKFILLAILYSALLVTSTFILLLFSFNY